MLALLLGVRVALAGPAAVEYGPDTAAADANTVLRARGKEYTEARARLEAHPEPAASALLSALEQPLGPAERQRALSILSSFRRPELISMFSDLLRQALVEGRGMDPWRGLLIAYGSTAAPALTRLAGDRQLTTEDRSVLLNDLVAVTEQAKLPSLVEMLGGGDRELQAQLRRSLTHRGRKHAGDEAVIIAALDEAIDAGAPRQRAACILLRASLTNAPDAELEARLVRIGGDESADFVVRAAAIRGLEAVGGAERDQALVGLARLHLSPERRESQASEILGWLALRALPTPQAAPVVDALDLVHADAPRLAALGYSVGRIDRPDWLESSRRHAWPEVRTAAIERVQRPCARGLVPRLAEIAGPVSRGGDAEAGVARAAIVAIGRCEDATAIDALLELLHEDGITYEQRAEAARQLVEHGGAAGAKAVAKALTGAGAPLFAERLAGALARARTPDDTIRHALCTTIETVPNAAATARRSFDRVFPGQRCADAG